MGKKRSLDFHLLSMCKWRLYFFPSDPSTFNQYWDARGPSVTSERATSISLLLIQRYGGPGSQNVDSRFGVEWSHYLASALDFVVAHMDVRGTGFSGEEFMHAVHHQLGAIEAGDSMRVVR